MEPTLCKKCGREIKGKRCVCTVPLPRRAQYAMDHWTMDHMEPIGSPDGFTFPKNPNSMFLETYFIHTDEIKPEQ